ncbi:VanZ like family protein [Flavobacteriaceae bacterium MAR_2010_105]|nr:VanZ like family protein [Flavobacteriaceae bacterium MAR_2010_105]
MEDLEPNQKPWKPPYRWFTSAREQWLWLWVFAVFAAIFSTLVIGKPLATQLRDQNIQALFFGFGLLLVVAAVIVHALKTKPSKMEVALLLGLVAVYIMLIFRLGAPERSHLIEYSVLAICIHKALIERANQRHLVLQPALLAMAMAFLIGVLDESIQLLLPHRVFDPEDIVFNGIAVVMAIGSRLLLIWVRTLLGKP